MRSIHQAVAVMEGFTLSPPTCGTGQPSSSVQGWTPSWPGSLAGRTGLTGFGASEQVFMVATTALAHSMKNTCEFWSPVSACPSPESPAPSMVPLIQCAVLLALGLAQCPRTPPHGRQGPQSPASVWQSPISISVGDLASESTSPYPSVGFAKYYKVSLSCGVWLEFDIYIARFN